MRTVINITLVISIVSMAAIAFLIMPIWGYMLFGLIGGLATPPIQPAVRTIYPKMVTSKQLVPLFSLDASAQEIIWIMGPVLTTLPRHSNLPAGRHRGGRSISYRRGNLVCHLSRGPARFASRPGRGQLGTVLRKGPVLLATITGFLLIGAAAAVEVAVVSVFGDKGPASRSGPRAVGDCLTDWGSRHGRSRNRTVGADLANGHCHRGNGPGNGRGQISGGSLSPCRSPEQDSLRRWQ